MNALDASIIVRFLMRDNRCYSTAMSWWSILNSINGSMIDSRFLWIVPPLVLTYLHVDERNKVQEVSHAPQCRWVIQEGGQDGHQDSVQDRHHHVNTRPGLQHAACRQKRHPETCRSNAYQHIHIHSISILRSRCCMCSILWGWLYFCICPNKGLANEIITRTSFIDADYSLWPFSKNKFLRCDHDFVMTS